MTKLAKPLKPLFGAFDGEGKQKMSPDKAR